jgi:ATP-dependent Clp protease protease subunit
MGSAIGMSALLLAAGTKGKRSALPNSKLLLHQSSIGLSGQSTDIEIHAREALKMRDRVNEIYAEHTGKPVAEVKDDLARDRFFTAEQAVEYGLIDRALARH